eukprot:2020259-Prymnesium_polylepis.1
MAGGDDDAARAQLPHEGGRAGQLWREGDELDVRERLAARAAQRARLLARFSQVLDWVAAWLAGGEERPFE